MTQQELEDNLGKILWKQNEAAAFEEPENLTIDHLAIAIVVDRDRSGMLVDAEGYEALPAECHLDKQGARMAFLKRARDRAEWAVAQVHHIENLAGVPHKATAAEEKPEKPLDTSGGDTP